MTITGHAAKGLFGVLVDAQNTGNFSLFTQLSIFLGFHGTWEMATCRLGKCYLEADIFRVSQRYVL